MAITWQVTGRKRKNKKKGPRGVGELRKINSLFHESLIKERKQGVTEDL